MADSALTLFYEFSKNKSLIASQGLGPTLDITRTTEKRVFGSNKLLQTVASGVAGFDHDPLTGESLGLSIEEARTNLAIHSGDTSDAAWVASNMTKETTSVIDPTGSPNTNVRLTASAANGTLLQTVTSDIDDYSYAVFMKRVTGTGDIQLTVDNGTTWTTKTLTTDWTRFDVSDASETNPVFGVRIVTDTDAIDFWGSDLNKNTIIALSHIPTVASSVTRNKDLIKTTDLDWVNESAGSFYCRVRMPHVVGNQSVSFLTLSKDANDRSLLQKNTDTNTAWIINDTTEQARLNAGSWADDTEQKIAACFALNDFEHFIDGSRAGTGDQSGTLPSGFTDFHVGANRDGNIQLNGHIREIRYYNVRKDNQFLEDLSNGLINEGSLSFSRNLARTLTRDLARTL